MGFGPFQFPFERCEQDGSLACTIPVRGGRVISCDVSEGVCTCTVQGNMLHLRVPPEAARTCKRVTMVDVETRDGFCMSVERPDDLAMGKWLLQCARDYGKVSQPQTLYRLPGLTLTYRTEHVLGERA